MGSPVFDGRDEQGNLVPGRRPADDLDRHRRPELLPPELSHDYDGHRGSEISNLSTTGEGRGEDHLLLT